MKPGNPAYEFDVLILGSGMGGLVAGAVLARLGYRVCMVEKNRQLGGCLQIFVRDRVVFDSGVHYLGGLEKGQVLHQIFRWLDVLPSLKLERMDPVFDRVLLEGDDKEYPLAQGYGNFIRQLTEHFPNEEQGLEAYCAKIRAVCHSFPLYNLRRGGSASEKEDYLRIPAQGFIESVVRDPKLRAILAGNNMLYAGVTDETPFYVHALIVNSYIESAWRCVDGGWRIAASLAATIRRHGGTILNHKTVTRILTAGDSVVRIECSDGTAFRAAAYISNLAPEQTVRMLDSPFIRPATRKRYARNPHTVSSFIVNAVLRKDRFPYRKHNWYFHRQGQIWSMNEYGAGNWPLGYALYMAPSSKSPEFAEGLTIFAYMRYEEVAAWAGTHNTIDDPEERGPGYEAFKQKKAAALLDCVEERFPGLRGCIEKIYTSTPLSYRDYIGNDQGSLYGFAKNYRDPFSTLVPARTKLRNFFMTGQHLNLHGILGTAISGLITASELMQDDSFIENIRNA